MPALTLCVSNERLEFLGDRVLGLIVAEKLHALYPDDAEGALALKFNALGAARCLRGARRKQQAWPIISSWRMRKPAAAGARKRAILAGACEAVIAALYLDGGMDAARRFVDAYWNDAFAALGADMRDAKTVLQEWAQSRETGKGAPVYKLIGREGPDHAPRFVVEASVTGVEPRIGRAAPSAKPNRTPRRKLLIDFGIDDMSQRCGFAAIIGAPNAGKSTLVNALVGTKVAIVSPKVQTTRMQVRGVAMRGDTQIVFVDTPGYLQAAPPAGPRDGERGLGGRGRCRCRRAAGGCAGTLPPIRRDMPPATPPRSSKASKPRTAKPRWCSTRSTRMKRAELLPLVETLNAHGIFDHVFMISALKGDGLDDLADWCAGEMPEGPWLYPADQAADIPSRLLAAEITREKIYLRLHDELPYASAVETEKWEERKDGSVKIDQIIYVQRDGQKAIVLGKGGATIKKIGELARKEMEEIFGRRVHLFLFVKVREDWADKREHYREMGLEFPEE